MNLYDGIITRRSVRRFIPDKPIAKEIIMDLIKAAQYAPSAHNTKPWEFLVIEDKETLCKFRTLQRMASFADGASAAIIVCVDKEKSYSREKEDWSFIDSDGSAATMNILYAAQDKGLGACWCGVSPMTKPINDIKEYFNMPENVVPFSIVVLGYPEGEIKQPENRFREEYIHWEKW